VEASILVCNPLLDGFGSSRSLCRVLIVLDRSFSTLLGRSCALQDEEYALFTVSFPRGVLCRLALTRTCPFHATIKILGSWV